MVHRCGQKPSGEEVSVSLSYALRTTDRLTIVNGKKAHLCTTNTFISILFLREESSRQRYLDSYLQDNSGECNTPRQTQCVPNSIFPHFIMVIMMCCGGGRVVVCGLWVCVGAQIEGAPKKKKNHHVGILPLSI